MRTRPLFKDNGQGQVRDEEYACWSSFYHVSQLNISKIKDLQLNTCLWEIRLNYWHVVSAYQHIHFVTYKLQFFSCYTKKYDSPYLHQVIVSWRSALIVFIWVSTWDFSTYCINKQIWAQSKKEGKDQESIQSSTTPDPGYQWESDNVTIRPYLTQDTNGKVTTLR